MTSPITPPIPPHVLNLDRRNTDPVAPMPKLPEDLSRFEGDALSRLATTLPLIVVAYVRAGQAEDALLAASEFDRISAHIEAVIASCDCPTCVAEREGKDAKSVIAKAMGHTSKRAPDGSLLQ